MKITLQIDGETFTEEGDNFYLLLNFLADSAGLKKEEERIKILDTEQLSALESL